MKKIFIVHLLSVFSLILFSEGVDFSYKLEKPSRVSVVIERSDGRYSLYSETRVKPSAWEKIEF